MSMDIEQNKDESEKQNVINHPTPLSSPHHLHIVQTPNPLAPSPNSSSLQAHPASGHTHSHLAAHTPIQAPRSQGSSQAAFSPPTANSSSPPSELIAAEQVPPNLRHHHSISGDAAGISPLARSHSAMEAAKSPDSQHCHKAAVQQKQLFSPQPTNHSGGAIGIAMPPQFILNQASPNQGLWPTKSERSAIDDEVGLKMVEANGSGSIAKPCALDSIISDVVESVVQERGLLLASAGDASPLAHRNYRGSPSSATAQHTPTTQRSSRTFFRAPGLEAPSVEAVAGAADSNILVCHVCAFSCSSKFHYNSHMNTHSDHQCPIHQCNYTSRTEGRLRKHVRESHTREQRAAAGIPEPIEAATATTAFNDASPTTMGISHNGNITNLNESLSNTMASIFDIVNRAAPNGNCQLPTSTSSNDTLLKMVDGNGCYNPRQPASALDHIKALTERNLLATHPVSAEALSGASSMIMMANGGSQTPSSSANDKAKLTPSKRAGKPKSYKCKNCDHISHSKDEQWIHARLHIPPDKQLTCKQCLFVTEYKHHLEYHYRNHAGSKPFQCTHPMCHYQCVNKSMLNSHMKSHTKVYQFKCLDCSYQTKYCHSLKMHLRKYSHRRAPGLHLGSESHEDEEMPESDESGNNTLLQQRLQQQQGLQQDLFGGIGAAASNTTTSGDEDHPSSSNESLSKADDASQLAHHPTLNSMLLRPMAVGQQQSSVPSQMVVNSGPSTIQQYASHLLLRQQQHAEMMRAAVANLLQCAQCDYQTPNNDEMVRHNLQHLLMGHHQAQQQNSVEHQPSQRPQALINLYHNLAAAQQQQQHHHHSLPPGVAQAHTPQQSLPNTMLEQLLNSGAGSVDLAAAAQFQQELALRLQQQQHHQQQQQRVHEEENRRRAAAVAAALAAAAELHEQQQQQQYHHAISVGGGGSDQSVKTESRYNIQPPSTSVPITSVTVDDHSHDLHLPLHPHDGSAAEDSASPSESKSTTQTDGGTSSGSPSSEATPGGSRMKQRKQSKTSKVDQISVRLQSKCSTPENANTEETAAQVVTSSGGGSDIDKRRDLNGNALLNSTSTIPSSNANNHENGSNPAVNTLLMHLSHQMQERQRAEMQTHSALQSTRPAGSMPYTCQHCMLGFQDRALYQIHLGYHGYESPFKCNRCGYQSASSLEFNLHLYQAKHD